MLKVRRPEVSAALTLRAPPSNVGLVNPANGIIRSTRRRRRSGTQQILGDMAIELMRSGEP
jgi:hypothetical protein